MADDIETLKLRARALQLQNAAQNAPTDQGGNSFIRNLIRTGAQGLSFGTADEIEAFIRSKLGDQTYAENRDSIRSEINLRKKIPR